MRGVMKMHLLYRLFHVPRSIFTNDLKRRLSTKHFSKHGCLYRTVTKNSKVVFGQRPSPQVSEQCKVSHSVIATRGLHFSHRDYDIVDLLEQGRDPLPSELGLCTYTPEGAYLYLLETVHESLSIDWPLSIALSSVLIRLAIIPLMMKRQKEIDRRNNFTAGILLNSLLSKEQKKTAKQEADRDYQDLQKLQNSIFNNLIFHRSFVYLKLQEFLPQIVATLIFADSILNLDALMGTTYIYPPDCTNYFPLTLLMFILTMSPSIIHCLQPGNEKSFASVVYFGMMWLGIINSMSVNFRLFLLPMMSISAVLKILQKYKP